MPVLSEVLPNRTPTRYRWRIWGVVFLMSLALAGVLLVALRGMPRDHPYTLRLGGHVVYVCRLARPAPWKTQLGSRANNPAGVPPAGFSWGTGGITVSEMLDSPPLLAYPYRLCYTTAADCYLLNWY